MPLDDAVYAPSVDKIFGMMGPYCIQFNPITGVRENIARVMAPMFGPCHLTYHAASAKIYCTGWNDESWQGANLSPRADIFPVDPVTLAIASPLGIVGLFTDLQFLPNELNGPVFLVSSGNYLYLAVQLAGDKGLYFRVNPLNTADHAGSGPIQSWNWASGGVPTGNFVELAGVLYWTNPQGPIRAAASDFSGHNTATWTQCNLTTALETPFALAVANGFTWAVCGNATLIKVLTYAQFGPGTYQSGDPGDGGNFNANLNLENGAAIVGTVLGVAPYRIRYNSVNGLLYMACQSKDGVIIYNPSGGAILGIPPMNGVFKGGFDGPVDCVFTPTKQFAVQSGPTGLREIT